MQATSHRLPRRARRPSAAWAVAIVIGTVAATSVLGGSLARSESAAALTLKKVQAL